MKKIIFILFLFSISKAFPQAGNLDSTFGLNGIGQNSFFDGGASSHCIQPDGQILVSGSSSNFYFALARYKINGKLDSSFGINGKVETHIGFGNNSMCIIALQSDGKIIGGCECKNSNNKACFALVRFNSNGNIDNSFGNNGIVITAITTNYDDYAFAVAIQIDGKILQGGLTDTMIGAAVHAYFAIVRYNTNGTLDNTFGINGKVSTQFMNPCSCISSIVLQPDNKILAGGWTGMWTFGGAPCAFAVARYNSNGTLDNSFGTGGMVTTYFGAGGNIGASYDDDEAQEMMLQQNGKILVSGNSTIGTGINGFRGSLAIIRLNSDGTFDNSFGVAGKDTFNVPNFGVTISAMTIQPDNKIVLGGAGGNVFCNESMFTVVRLDSNGVLDNSFGVNGAVFNAIDTSHSSNNWIFSISMQQDGKIVASGNSYKGLTVARYLSSLNLGVPLIPQQKNELQIYPNPADGNLHVHYLNEEEKPAAINIFDIQGKLMLTKDCTNFTGDMDIDVSEIPQGMYFVKVGSQAKKFVKE